MKIRIVSVLLALCMLLPILPLRAANASDLTTFSMALTSGTETTYYDLMDGTPSIPFKKGDSYVFRIGFRDPSVMEKVYVSGETAEGKLYLEAFYNEEQDLFLTSGYFGGNTVVMPLVIRVEYREKSPEIMVAEEFDLDRFVVPGVSEYSQQDAGPGCIAAHMKISEVLKSDTDVIFETLFGTYDASGGDQDALDEWLGAFSDLGTMTSYLVPGADNGKYCLYLDYSDPSTHVMILHDTVSSTYTKFIVETFVKDKPGSIVTVSQRLEEVSAITGLVSDYFSIASDTNDLRRQVRENTSLTQAEMEEAYEKIDRLEDDRRMFSVATTVLPALVAMGTVAGGAPGLMFSAWLAAINASAGFFWDKRMGFITADSFSPGWVGSGTCGAVNKEDVRWELSGGVLTVSGSGEMKFGYPYEFYFPAVKKVVVTDGVTNAGFPALPNCTEVVLAPSVTKLSTYAFQGFSSLESINLPQNLTTIGGLAFAKTALKSITIPSKVTAIGSRAFSQCSLLKEVTFNTGAELASFKDGILSNIVPFYECSSLETITFTGDMPTELIASSSGGAGKLLYLSGRPNVYYPYENETWKEATDAIDAIWKPGNNSHLVFIALGGPSGKCGADLYWEMNRDGDLFITGTGEMDSYYSSADPQWAYVYNLRSVTIGEGVTSIGREAFDDCSGIRGINISDTVATLGSGAFYGCTGLLSLHIPASLVNWHRNEPHGLEFSDCTSLRAITVDPDHPFLYSKDGVLYHRDGILMYCPRMKTGIHIVDEGTVELQGGSFVGCEGITQVLLPASLAEMGDYNHSVFGGCTGLSGIWYMGSETMWNGIEKYYESITWPVYFLASSSTAEVKAEVTEGGSVLGGGTYLVGTEVHLTAVPEEGNCLVHWQDEKGSIISEEPELSISISGAASVTAVFAPVPEFGNIELTDNYVFDHTASLDGDGDIFTLSIAGPEAESALCVAALYNESGRMTGMTVFEAERGEGSASFSGRITSGNAVIYLLTGDMIPMAPGIRAK